jgi:hypothetical protein
MSENAEVERKKMLPKNRLCVCTLEQGDQIGRSFSFGQTCSIKITELAKNFGLLFANT